MMTTGPSSRLASVSCVDVLSFSSWDFSFPETAVPGDGTRQLRHMSLVSPVLWEQLHADVDGAGTLGLLLFRRKGSLLLLGFVLVAAKN